MHCEVVGKRKQKLVSSKKKKKKKSTGNSICHDHSVEEAWERINILKSTEEAIGKRKVRTTLKYENKPHSLVQTESKGSDREIEKGISEV